MKTESDAQALHIESEERGLYFSIKLTGRMTAKHILAIRKILEGALEIGHTRILMELSGVDYMDSMGIGLIVNFNKKIKDIKGQLVIANPSSVATDIIEVSGTDAFLDVRRDIADLDQVF